MLEPARLKEAIKAEADRLGFVLCGFARADAVPEAGEELKRWLELGRHGSMGWMEERAGQRAHPQALWPEARSVIALAMSYAPDGDPRRLAEEPDRARISVYAQGADYHKTVKKALKALARLGHRIGAREAARDEAEALRLRPYPFLKACWFKHRRSLQVHAGGGQSSAAGTGGRGRSA